MPTYSYSLSADTVNGVVDNNSLRQEIENSTIAVVYQGYSTSGDTIDLLFKAALSTEEQTTLTGILNAHTGTSSIVEDVTWVKIAEEDVAAGLTTQGHFKAVGLKHSVPSGVGTTSTSTFTFPYPVGLLNMVFTTDANKEQDTFDVHIAPDTTIGNITQDVSVSDTILNVSPTVIQNCRYGSLVTLDDGNNSEALGYIVGIDKVNNTITVENAVTQGFAAATPTYIKQTIEVVKDVEIQGTAAIDIGKTKIGAAFLPAGTPIKFIYKNNQGNAKIFSAILELLY